MKKATLQHILMAAKTAGITHIAVTLNNGTDAVLGIAANMGDYYLSAGCQTLVDGELVGWSYAPNGDMQWHRYRGDSYGRRSVWVTLAEAEVLADKTPEERDTARPPF